MLIISFVLVGRVAEPPDPLLLDLPAHTGGLSHCLFFSIKGTPDRKYFGITVYDDYNEVTFPNTSIPENTSFLL